ncbi:MAG: lipid-A-disaccharide synthase [Halothiobacillus sp. 24-54-40]|jgi:lipid-A-disaccharide synthase|nr:MAG: lipid-A-disaccharide synthase [Halothiobacillus sp. 35-54-62]OYY55936.1 MAG: lipid-A-disaccharide synthase [Halothiobacillus sp. 28-55-5]OYZ86341.1 MAG: lipid-A-disaccharide synthase [Halothiobacillus sp. 24-54-40]OZA81124.1 MAG: lipid-A-disaccharide synthase [Halothiobacillus sp. 39-53-45]HQS03649.1 lipid-A-disaccharide synthase [Halothiobacillus sp.]
MTDPTTAAPRPLRLFFAAGEASGDHYAAQLFQRLKAVRPGSVAQGLGGTESRLVGIETVVDLNTVSVMGLVEVLRHYSGLKRALNTLIAALETFQPDLLIVIDFQEFNQRLARAARARGIKVLFFVAPQVWAWRPKRAEKFAEVADHLAVLFDFEVPLFAHYGLPTTHVGHPLRDMIPTELIKTPANRHLVVQAARLSLGIATQDIMIGLLPGSRRSELTRLLPVLLASAQQLLDSHPDWRFLLPQAASIPDDWFNNLLETCKPSTTLRAALMTTRGQARQVMAATDVLVIASGTATLEAALIGTPMVIVYKTNPITYWIAKHLVNIQHIGLPNIVLNERVFPELIQAKANPAAIVNKTLELVKNKSILQKQEQALAEIPSHLGKTGALEQLTQLTLNLIED